MSFEDRAVENTSAELIWDIAIPSPINRNTYFACPFPASAVFLALSSATPFAKSG
jgi:hypothetical protein